MFEIPVESAPSNTDPSEVNPPVEVQNKVNPCGTLFKYEDGWCVTTEAGVNYVFPTLGTALGELKRKLLKMDE